MTQPSALLLAVRDALNAFDAFLADTSAQWSEPHPLREAFFTAMERLRVEVLREDVEDRG